MKRILFAQLSAILMVASLSAQVSFPSYRSLDFQLTPPGAMKSGLYGYDNPALVSLIEQPDVYFSWSDASARWNDFNRWGLFLGLPRFGFGVIHQKLPDGYVDDYRMSLAGGSRALSFGAGIGWSRGAAAMIDRSTHIAIGVLSRPNKHLSVGLVATGSTSRGSSEYVADVGIRPLGTEVLTLFGDYSVMSHQSLRNAAWSAGVVLEALPGVRIVGRYFDTKTATVGVQLSLGRAAVSAQSHYDGSGNYASSSYGIRLGAYDRTIVGKLRDRKRNYVEMNLLGPLKYQRFVLFDQANTLANVTAAIDAAKADPTVAGIAINTSGISASRVMLWEVREKLKEFRAAGKHVVIFVDRPGIDVYHFASVADKIVMDSQGLLFLEGYIMGRTFVKGALEKIGIGYDEWRFFKYKSAAESFSRDRMSEADREQRQRLVEDYYRLAKEEICEARGFAAEQFDEMVNNETLFLAKDALERGLVDTLGRWETVKEVIKKLEGNEKKMMATGALEKFNLPNDNRWGEPPRIAVIYALGACAMDEGITARKLVKDVESAVNDRRVKAIVLRVDSPGGDALASDYIAEALLKAKGKKPVVVSQGFVAASGGYWLSMYADTIVAAPTTITGSIGVIGGWMYNLGLKESLGLSTDLVKAGEHADLGFGFTLPFLGVGIPDRNLTEAERARMEVSIKTLYSDFVQKVATGRKKGVDDIEPIAQGRVWSGYDGLKLGLVDVLGGLETAVRIAKQRAGLREDEEVTIVELPRPGLFNPSMFIPRLFGIDASKTDPVLEHLQFRLKNNGVPMPLLPIEEIDFRAMEY